MRIADREIGPGHPVFVVAEISCNHEGDLQKAVDLIVAAKWAGADAVKFQAFRPEDMTVESDDPRYRLTDGPWAGRRLWDLYTEAQTPFAWFSTLFDLAREQGLIPFASVFSLEGIAMLEALDCPAYKIASAERDWNDLRLAALRTGKPVLASTIYKLHSSQVVTMSCVPEYPTSLAHMRVPTVHPARRWGLSDHSISSIPAIVAVTLGASVIEKHLMLDGSRSLDSGFALTPDAFALTVAAIRDTETCLSDPPDPPAEPQFLRRRVGGRWVRARY